MKTLLINMKSLLIVSILLLNCFIAKADVTVSSFKIPDAYLNSGKLNVPNSKVNTPFKFNVTLSRSLVAGSGFENVSGASITLVYSNSNGGGNYTNLMKERALSASDFYQGSTTNASGYAYLLLDAELPANIVDGYLMIKIIYYDSVQKKMVTKYLVNSTIGIKVATAPSIPKVPIYLIAGRDNGEYYLSLDDAMSTPQEYSNRGIYYYAYRNQAPNTVPVYEFKGKSNDVNGEPSFPENITYYSTSSQSPTQVLTGLGSYWGAAQSKVAFYAYKTQVAGTVPIYCYSHPYINLFLFTQNPPNDSMIQKEIAFYAFPVN